MTPTGPRLAPALPPVAAARRASLTLPRNNSTARACCQRSSPRRPPPEVVRYAGRWGCCSGRGTTNARRSEADLCSARCAEDASASAGASAPLLSRPQPAPEPGSAQDRKAVSTCGTRAMCSSLHVSKCGNPDQNNDHFGVRETAREGNGRIGGRNG